MLELYYHEAKGAKTFFVEEACRQAGLHAKYAGATLSLNKGPRPWPVVFAGPLLVEVEDVTQFAASATGSVALKVRAYGLPRLVVDRFFGDFRRMKVEEIVDAEGHDLHDPDGPLRSQDVWSLA